MTCKLQGVVVVASVLAGCGVDFAPREVSPGKAGSLAGESDELAPPPSCGPYCFAARYSADEHERRWLLWGHGRSNVPAPDGRQWWAVFALRRGAATHEALIRMWVFDRDEARSLAERDALSLRGYLLAPKGRNITAEKEQINAMIHRGSSRSLPPLALLGYERLTQATKIDFPRGYYPLAGGASPATHDVWQLEYAIERTDELGGMSIAQHGVRRGAYALTLGVATIAQAEGLYFGGAALVVGAREDRQ